MNLDQNQKFVDHMFSFPNPAEADFFNPDQLKQLDAERAKRDTSREFVEAIIEKDDFEERIQQSILNGRIYNSSQMNATEKRLSALDFGDGTRVDAFETLVSPDGTRIISSENLQDLLSVYGDTYITKDRSNELSNALSADGVPGPQIDRINAALLRQGFVSLQRGVFLVLKGMLEDSIGHTLPTFNPGSGKGTRNEAIRSTTPPAPPSDQLPFSFVEYMRNTDKEFDRVEHEIINDLQFREFFSGLQKQYAYYQDLPAERMAGEIMVRPQLWSKLSPQTKVWVQNIVNRNRDEFQAKVGQVAQSAHLEKLEELKQSLAK